MNTTLHFLDKRSKFVHYHPRTVILNNLEYDHADIFPDVQAIKTQFHHLMRTVPSSGLAVVKRRRCAPQRNLGDGLLDSSGNVCGWRLACALFAG